MSIDNNKNHLVDSFGRKHSYLRISVTDRCNLRCFYCMPHDGIEWLDKKKLLTFDELERVSRIFVEMGVRKIRLTGGEPLVRRDLPVLIQKLASIDKLECLSMTSNALLLADYAKQIRQAGITHLNLSIDSLRQERFSKITGRDAFDQVFRGIEKSLEVGFPSIKLNVVVISGVNDDEILDFLKYAEDKPVNVRFIEFMPFKNNDWNIEKIFSYAQMREIIEEKYRLNPLDTEPSAVAKDFAMRDKNNNRLPCSVSFVTSMTESFCSTCNRMRLTSDGSIKSCLFYPAETNIRDAMRSGAKDEEIKEMILYSLNQKPEAHPPAEEIAATDNRAMIEIGG